MINFYKGTQAEYVNKKNTGDDNNLYFVTDTHSVVLNGVSYSGVEDVKIIKATKDNTTKVYLVLYGKGIASKNKNWSTASSTSTQVATQSDPTVIGGSVGSVGDLIGGACAEGETCGEISGSTGTVFDADSIRIDITDIVVSDKDRANLKQLESALSGAGLNIEYTSAENKDFQAPYTVGGITKGTKVSSVSGKTVSEVFDQILFPTIQPIVSKRPSATLSFKKGFDPFQIVGTTINYEGLFVPSGDSGQVTLNGVNMGAYAGDVSNKNVYEGTDHSANFLVNPLSLGSGVDTKVIKGPMLYQAEVTFAAGEKYKNNKGDASDLDAFPGGTVASNNLYIYGVYPIYYALTEDQDKGIFVIDTSTKSVKPTSWGSSEQVTLTFSLGSETDSTHHAFAISKYYTDVKVKMLNTLSGNYDPISSFSQGGQNGSLGYNYYVNTGSKTGAATYQITYTR